MKQQTQTALDAGLARNDARAANDAYFAAHDAYNDALDAATLYEFKCNCGAEIVVENREKCPQCGVICDCDAVNRDAANYALRDARAAFEAYYAARWAPRDGETELCDDCGEPDARCGCDPTPWCTGCGSMTKSGCDCGPIADNN